MFTYSRKPSDSELLHSHTPSILTMAELSKTLTITLGCKWLISPQSVCVQAQLAQKPAHTTLQQLGSREASFGQRETVSWILKQLAILFFFLNQDLLRELWPCLHWKLHEGKACPVGEKSCHHMPPVKLLYELIYLQSMKQSCHLDMYARCPT